MTLLDHLETFTLQKLNIKDSQLGLYLRGESMANQNPDFTAYHELNRDPIAAIKANEATMIPELLAMRHQRMGQSAFTFYRGTAGLMDADFKAQSQSDIPLIICGDAHINNFGFFASPERKLLFDLNDFDEARIGNWESDVKRLLVSVYLAGEEMGYSKKQLKKLVKHTAKAYKNSVNNFYQNSLPQRYYSSFDINDMIDTMKRVMKDEAPQMEKALQKILSKAHKQNSDKVIAKKTEETEDGRRVFVEDPPRIKHVDQKTTQKIIDCYWKYQGSVRSDIRVLLASYHVEDVVRYSVGVGSFGTRCFLILLTGSDDSHIVLQVKEALPTLFNQQALGRQEAFNRSGVAGKRIVDAQRVMQSASDPFLGEAAIGGRSFYFRQFRDMKESIDVFQLGWNGYVLYAYTCAFVLARAHAQSPTFPMVAGFINTVHKPNKHLANWSVRYVQQVHEDYQAFLAAVKDGSLPE